MITNWESDYENHGPQNLFPFNLSYADGTDLPADFAFGYERPMSSTVEMMFALALNS